MPTSGNEWFQILGSWSLLPGKELEKRFQDKGYTDVSLWYYLSDEDLRSCGLNSQELNTFRKLIDQWVRKQWIAGSPVQIYSQSKSKWFDGIVTDSISDEEGEWLQIRYNKTTSKQVQRFCEDIRAPPVLIPEQRAPAQKANHRPRSTSVSIDAPADLKLITDLTVNQRLALAEKHAKRGRTVSDMEARSLWKKDEYVEVYSRSKDRWLLGRIYAVGNDEEGEYLEVHYHDKDSNQNSKKRVGRYDEEIRVVPPFEDENAGRQTMSQGILEDPGLMDDDSEEDFPETAMAVLYRRKELGALRQQVLLKEGNIVEIEQNIKDLRQILEEEKRDLHEVRFRLQKEETRHSKQGEIIKKQSRKKWKRGSFMEVYSNSRKQWFLAECQDIFEDAEGEWLQVVFCDPTSEQTIMKQIQRFSEELRPCETDRTPPIGSVNTNQFEALRRIHELPKKEAKENEDWSAYHAEHQQEEEELFPEVTAQRSQGGLSQNTRDRRQSHALSNQEEEELGEMSGEKIYVLYQQQTHEIFANINDTVHNLMRRLQVKLHVEPEAQELLLDNVVLNRGDILKDYSIRRGSTLFLKVQDKMTQKRIQRSRAARGSTADVYQDHLAGGSYEDVTTGDPMSIFNSDIFGVGGASEI